MTREEALKAVLERRDEVLAKTPWFNVEGDRVMARVQDPGEQISAGGIITPETAKQMPYHGWVVACGNGPISSRYRRGCFIIWAKYGGTDFEWGSCDVRFVNGNDIWGYYDDPMLIAAKCGIISRQEAGIPNWK